MSTILLEDGESEFTTVIFLGGGEVNNAAQQKPTTQHVALRSHGPDSRSGPSHKLSQLSQMALTACNVARSEFLSMSTFAMLEHSLVGLVRSACDGLPLCYGYAPQHAMALRNA